MHGAGSYLSHCIPAVRVERDIRIFLNPRVSQYFDSFINRAVVQVIVTNLFMKKNDGRRARLFRDAGDLKLVGRRGTEFLRMRHRYRNKGENETGEQDGNT